MPRRTHPVRRRRKIVMHRLSRAARKARQNRKGAHAPYISRP